MTDTMAGIKLDVGAGLYPQPGYIPVDAYCEGEGFIKADMWDLPWPDNSVEEIWCSHALEHVLKKKVVPTLKEFHRVLQPGGLLVLEVPDLVWCCKNWLSHLDNGWNMDAIFGNQDEPGGQIHYTGFTPEILQGYLAEAGFGRTHALWSVWNHEQNCIHVEVTKAGKR
jgi:predicted SAM-dependent methyltransferase